MRISEIPEGANLELHFLINNKHYSLKVKLHLKASEYILIQKTSANGVQIEKILSFKPALVYKTDKGIYKFTNIAMRLVYYNGTYLYAITSTLKAEQENRRDAFRVFMSNPMSMKVTKRDGTLCQYFGLLKDLSMTGMGIVLKYKIEDILFMEISIDWDKNFKFTLNGEVIRIKELPYENGFLYGCRFFKKDEQLNRYLLKIQALNKINQ